MIPYKKFPFCRTSREITMSTETKEIPVMNQTHLINTDFSIIFRSLWGNMISKLARIYVGRSAVQILAGARKLYLIQKIQTSSRAQPASKSSFFSGRDLASAEILTTHICLEPSLKITGALPPLKLSPSMAQIETTLSYLNHLPKNISLNRSHPFWSYKGTFLYSSYCLHAHYMTHLFHLY